MNIVDFCSREIRIGKKMRIFYPPNLNVATLPIFCFSVGQIALP